MEGLVITSHLIPLKQTQPNNILFEKLVEIFKYQN